MKTIEIPAYHIDPSYLIGLCFSAKDSFDDDTMNYVCIGYSTTDLSIVGKSLLGEKCRIKVFEYSDVTFKS